MTAHDSTRRSTVEAEPELQRPRRRPRHRLAALVAALALTTSGLTAVATAPTASAASTSSAEQQFSSLLNASRRQYGRASLSRRSDLDAVARAWARSMASRNKLSHNPQLTRQVRGWRYVGENVGVGPSSSTLHQALMKSPGHRANILDRDFTQSGIGVAYGRGRMWVVQVFRRPSSTSVRSTKSSSKTIGYGSRGSTVKRLQRKLGVRTSGFFGKKTLRALKRYQKRKHLVVTGRLDSRTRRSLRL
jgi:uncharacterized protein YkwD